MWDGAGSAVKETFGGHWCYVAVQKQTVGFAGAVDGIKNVQRRWQLQFDRSVPTIPALPESGAVRDDRDAIPSLRSQTRHHRDGIRRQTHGPVRPSEDTGGSAANGLHVKPPIWRNRPYVGVLHGVGWGRFDGRACVLSTAVCNNELLGNTKGRRRQADPRYATV